MRNSIPQAKITEIREKASIVAVVSDFLSLKKSGKNYLGLCPFHGERTPSFTVNEEKGIFHCFGCGAGGSVFNFLMRAKGITFPEAVKEVAKRYGIALPERELSPEEQRRRSLQSRLLEINETAAAFYHQILTARKEGEEGRQYLAGRGISREIVEEHRLGFAPEAWDFLARFLQGQGVPLNHAATLGLVAPRKEAGGFYDRLRRRVIFPIVSEAGRVIGFGGRIIAPAEGDAPKYLNSPESPVYSKGQTLYGLNIARSAIRETGTALIVEGYMDLLSLHQAGFRNVVASLGTALTPAQVELLRRFAREVVAVFDADESGKKATGRSLELFLNAGIPARVVSLPPGSDPDSFVRGENGPGFQRLLDGALPVMEYLLEQAVARHSPETVDGKVQAARELIPVLNRLKDPLEQSLYAERVASRLGLKESLIRARLRGAQEPGEEGGRAPAGTGRGPAHERLLLQLMVFRADLIPRVREALGQEELSDPRYQKLARELVRLWEAGEKIDVQALLNRGEDDELRNLLSAMVLGEESVLDSDRMLEDCLKQVRLFRVRQEIRRVDEEIRQRSRAGGAVPASSGLRELLKRKQRLVLEQKRWMDAAAVRPPGAGQ